MARRVRRLFRGGRVVDLGGGHGLLAQILLLLDDSSPRALVVDPALPPSSAKLHDALVDGVAALWQDGSSSSASRMEQVELSADDLVVASHACGHLTEVVLDRAASARARVAVLPCCHHLAAGDTGGLTGWVDGAAAIDIMRASRLAERGYRIWTHAIPGGDHAKEPAADRRA